MPSSTSSSELLRPAAAVQTTPATLWSVWGLLGSVVVLLILVEIFARIVVPRVSGVEALIRTEEREALVMAPGNGRTSVLVAGNSLLEAGVEFLRLRSLLADGAIDARRYVVQNTAYQDWRFGLPRLIAGGARPDVFVLMLNWEQLTGNGFRGSYSAHRLLRLRDVLTVASDLGLSNTDTSALVLSNVSAFYGLREEIRKQAFHKVLPSLPQLTSLLVPPAAPRGKLSDERAMEIAVTRLTLLQREAQAKGARFILAVPPTATPRHDHLIQELRRRVPEVAVVMPLANSGLAMADYSDGFHLNARGAAVFTGKLAEALAHELSARQVRR